MTDIKARRSKVGKRILRNPVFRAVPQQFKIVPILGLLFEKRQHKNQKTMEALTRQPMMKDYKRNISVESKPGKGTTFRVGFTV